MTRYMLDTNTVSQLFRAHPSVSGRISATPIASLCISAITEAELLFGMARRPNARRLQGLWKEFRDRVDVLSWDTIAAQRYGTLRANMARAGKVVAALDLLIAAHALAAGAILVSNDQAFRNIPGLLLQDWT
jgi:tRNA(fMet)-specific endonuclease VapC